MGFRDLFAKPTKPTIHLEGPNVASGEIRIVGTTYYQRPAEMVARCNREENGRISFLATLVPEPDNPQDPNAIAVYGEGRRWRAPPRLAATKLGGPGRCFCSTPQCMLAGAK